MIQVIDNQVVQTELPLTGYLKNGESVSGYNHLSLELLTEEGWLPEVEDRPPYDKVTQMLEIDNYEIFTDKVLVHYKVVDIPIFG
jgi:hypothetical protein